jgi:cytochrome oxidase assembly protein ShyY1
MQRVFLRAIIAARKKAILEMQGIFFMETNSQIYDKWRIRGFFGALFAIIAIFLIAPIFEKNFYTHLLLQYSYVLLILSTVYAIDGKQTILKAGFFLLVPFIYFDLISLQQRSLSYMMVAYGFSSIFTLMAIIILMRKILSSSLVNIELIFGALMVYLLSGILWDGCSEF